MTLFWLELISEGQLVPLKRLLDLNREALELNRIFAAARRTAKNGPRRPD